MILRCGRILICLASQTQKSLHPTTPRFPHKHRNTFPIRFHLLPVTQIIFLLNFFQFKPFQPRWPASAPPGRERHTGPLQQLVTRGLYSLLTLVSSKGDFRGFSSTNTNALHFKTCSTRFQQANCQPSFCRKDS